MPTAIESLRFVKMHGAGNDYVYVNGFEQDLPTDRESLAELARLVSDRHTGIGSDGLILVLPPVEDGHVRMRMFNLDGSEGRMCGNGIRCVAKFAVDRKLVPADADPLRIETASGLREIGLVREGNRVVGATVDMGEPSFDLASMGITQAGGARMPGRGGGYKKVADYQYRLAVPKTDVALDVTFVSMGNPHAVVFVDDLSAVDLRTLGPAVSEHPSFAEGMNVHFTQVLSSDRVRVLHWERGSGPTQACGTGTCAVCVAGVVTGRTNRAVTVEVPGGALELNWQESTNHVQMTGPAVEVFEGIWRL